MSDEAAAASEAAESQAETESKEEDAPASEATESKVFDEEKAQQKIKKVNNEAANLRKRLKELEPKAKKAEELEDAQKSESEKLTERVKGAESEAASAKAEALRLRVALKKGLTETQAKRLIGETEEELEADADELVASFQVDDAEKSDEEESQEDDKKSARPPAGGGRTGATGDTDAEETDPRKLAQGLPSYS